jgi:very-short-patch-repair endonuclease
MARRLKGEEAMTLMLKSEGIVFEREYRFHPVRRWRFDFAIPELRIAIEVEGGVFSGGRHTRGIGYSNDLIKYNAATEMGWRVLRYATNQIDATALEQIRRVIGYALCSDGRRRVRD